MCERRKPCIKHVPSFSHGIHFFKRELSAKSAQIPAKSTQIPAKVRKSGFLHHWKSGFNKILSAGWLTFNLTISGLEGARIEKKCRNLCRGVVKLNDQVQFVDVPSPVQYDLGHCVTQCREHRTWGKDCQNALGWKRHMDSSIFPIVGQFCLKKCEWCK